MISVIIPAHNESAVIARTLRSITDGAQPGELDIVVVCNGCTDHTADIARSVKPGVRVIETAIASKTHALNLGDAAAFAFPRIYADADVVITVDAIRILANQLESSNLLAVAPTPKFDLAGCSWPVRACYHVRSLLPSAYEGIGGSGVYALSEAGRRRFGRFPEVIADDGYVRIQFQLEERETLRSISSTVFPPRTVKDLIAQKTRAHYGSFELESRFPSRWEHRGKSNNTSLIQLFKSPGLWASLFVYSFVTIVARHQARKRLNTKSLRWDRDDTSRANA